MVQSWIHNFWLIIADPTEKGKLKVRSFQNLVTWSSVDSILQGQRRLTGFFYLTDKNFEIENNFWKWNFQHFNEFAIYCWRGPWDHDILSRVSFSSCQRNLIKTFQIEGMIALINDLDFFLRLVKWPKIAFKKSQNSQKF